MKQVTYILGAGFSAPLGLPTMGNFVSKAKDLVASNPEKYKHFKRIFETIGQMAVVKNYINQNLHNIEDILSLLEMENFVGKRSIRREYVRFIREVIESYTPLIGPGPGSTLRPDTRTWPKELLRDEMAAQYLLFVLNCMSIRLGTDAVNSDWFFLSNALDTDTDYSIVTLNYDKVIENVKSFLLSTFPLQAGRIPELPIAKLHGSVDSDIIPPTWNKAVPKAISDSWKQAYGALRNANELRILGYSLPITDNHVKYMIAVALKDCENLKKVDVVTIDGDGSTQRRYQDMFSPFPNFRYKNSSLEVYLDHLTKHDTPFGAREFSYVRDATGGDTRPSIIANSAHFEMRHEYFMTP